MPSIPILDFALVDQPNGRKDFLHSLLGAFSEFGIFYVKNGLVENSAFEAARRECQAFFALPPEKRKEIDIANAPSFLGYTAVGFLLPRPGQNLPKLSRASFYSS